MDLPNEMWAQIVCFLRYVDVFNFSLTCIRFHLVLLSYKPYRERFALSHAVFGSDPDMCYSIMKCLDEVFENNCLGFSDLFKSGQYLKSILKIKLKNISYELLRFKVHEHLFSFQRGIRDVGRCNFCTMFFLEHSNEMILVKNAVHLFLYQCSGMEVTSLFEKVQVSDVYLNVFYKTSDFISHGPKNHNYGEIFTDLINNPFALHISYLEVYARLYFNLLKDVTQFVSFN